VKSPSAIFINKNTGRYFCYSLIILSFKPGRSVFLLPCQRKATPTSIAEFFKHCACPSGYFVKAVIAFAWRRQSSSAAFLCPAHHFSSVGKNWPGLFACLHFSRVQSTGCYAWLACGSQQAAGGGSFVS